MGEAKNSFICLIKENIFLTGRLFHDGMHFVADCESRETIEERGFDETRSS